MSPTIPAFRDKTLAARSATLTPLMNDRRQKVRLVGVRYAALDINLYELRSLDGAALAPSTAGSHIDLHLEGGLIRQYSLLPTDEPAVYRIGVKRDPESRGGSTFLHDRLRVGTIIEVSEPRNLFALDESAPYSVLIAGGIGITPLWSMAARLREIGANHELHYVARSPEHMALHDQVQGLAQGRTYFRDDAIDGGFDPAAIVRDAPAGAHFYFCGPPGLLEVFLAATVGIDATRVHIERFAGSAPAVSGKAVRVVLKRSLKTIVVEPGQTILRAIRGAGIDASYSCEQGVCGACEVGVLAGRVEHRDEILSEAERAANTTMMICCSSALDDELVLDL
jgi:ferredoxin-NADP reductase